MSGSQVWTQERSPPFGSVEIPARNENKGIQMAKCVGKSSFDPGKSPPVGDKELLPETGTKEYR